MLLLFLFHSKYVDDDDSDEEEEARRMEVGHLVPSSRRSHFSITDLFIDHYCFLPKRAASPSYIQEQRALKER